MTIVFYIFSFVAFIAGVWAIYISFLEESLIGFKTQHTFLLRFLGGLVIIISILFTIYIQKI